MFLFWAGICSFVTLVLLDLSSAPLAIKVEAGQVHVHTFDRVLRGAASPDASAITIAYRPQERFSTGQCLYSDEGVLQNGLSAFKCLIAGAEPTPPYHVFSTHKQYYRLFNPFRGSLLIGEGSTELRLDINVPDLTIEAWQRGEKLSTAELDPPTVLEIVSPLAPAFFFAMLLAVFINRKTRARDSRPLLVTSAERIDWLIAGLASLLGGALIGHLQYSVFNRMPGFGDEMNYLMQARIFANGHLSVPEPALAEFFRVNWMDMFGSDGRIWGFHPPGVSVLQTIGWIVGLYWLPVPLIAAALFGTQYLLGLKVFQTRFAAWLYLLVFGSSHYILSLCCSFMAHPASLLFLSLFTLALLTFHQDRQERSLVWAAFWLGCAFVTRPLSAVLGGAIPLVCVLPRIAQTRPRILAASVATGIVVASALGLYTYQITGKFAVPYEIKGPEVGNGLLKRFEAPAEEKLKNLYRNINEYQTRVHSFGIFGNVLLFFVPLFLRRHKKTPLVYVGYATFAFFVVLHSILHWYGWKWEPRMIFDISFIFFLLSTFGLVQLISAFGSRPMRALALIVFVGLPFGWVVVRDLPWRFATEYHNYLSTPAGVRHEVESSGLTNAIILFGSEVKFASYTPFNTPDFRGPIIYAKSLGPAYDYKLISAHPGRSLYYSANGELLEKRPNFYETDLKNLADYLSANDGVRTITVLPWLRYTTPDVHASIPGEKMDDSELLALIGAARHQPHSTEPIRIFLLGHATSLTSILDATVATEPVDTPPLDEAITARFLPSGFQMKEDAMIKGFRFTCHSGTEWRDPPEHTALVSTLSADQCEGENRSATWRTSFTVAAETTVTFFLDSDDGAALFLDGKIVLDNDLFEHHGRERRQARFTIAPGSHSLEVKYFNGPAMGFIEAGIVDDGGRDIPFSIDESFPLLFTIKLDDN